LADLDHRPAHPDVTAKRAIAAGRARAMAEAEGKVPIGKGGARSKAQSALCITDPRKHFALMFGVSPDHGRRSSLLVSPPPGGDQDQDKRRRHSQVDDAGVPPHRRSPFLPEFW
jgi:hypothetical protein